MNDVIIYPSSWYYNACVNGFLELLEFGLGTDAVEDFFQNNGTVKIPGDLMKALFSTEEEIELPKGYCSRIIIPEQVRNMKRIAWWWVEKSKKSEVGDPKRLVTSTCNQVFNHVRGLYPNLRPHNKKIPPDIFLNNWFVPAITGDLHCSFCNSLSACDCGAEDKTMFFSREISRHLGSSLKKYPNSFWDSHPNLFMCSYCRAYFLCFHFIHERGYFINSDSLEVNWYINRLVSGEKKSRSNRHHDALLSAISKNKRLRKALGSWELQNMELIEFERDRNKREMVNYYPLSRRLAELFLIPSVSSLLGTFVNKRYEKVWHTVLEERFDHLLHIAYKNLRVCLIGKNQHQDPEVFVESSQELLHPLRDLVFLTYEIQCYLKKKNGGKIRMNYINFRQIREAAGESPFDLSDNSSKNIVFRMLELARLNKRSEVYHILMRTYISHDKPFPDDLARLFELEDAELFKTGIYAFIAGLKYKKAKGEEKENNSVSSAKGDVLSET